MLTFRFLAFLNFLMDILYDTAQLYLLFQKSEIDFYEAFGQLELCLEEIKQIILIQIILERIIIGFMMIIRKDYICPSF